MALIANELSYTYGAGTSYSACALSRVSLTLAPGELLLVVGATGSGKSTLLRLLSGLLEPGEGSVLVDDEAPGKPGRVGIVFQNPETQFFAETVLEDVSFGPRNLRMADATTAATDALASVGMPAALFGDRSPFTLSGGEARRVAVAGVLAMRPRYLLLDEPTAGLDRSGRESVLGAIEAVRAHAGVLVVTHDPEQFLPVADRVLALASGAPVFDGDVCELLREPASYEGAGLVLPDIVRVQLLARDRGADVSHIALDPSGAAENLLRALGGRR